MSEENGDGEPEKKLAPTSYREPNGRLLPGHPGLPGGGRPPGSMDFMAICRRKAKEDGIDLEELVWKVGYAMYREAEKGDAACARIFLDRACGVIDKPSPMMAVQMNMATTNITEQMREDMLALIADGKNQSAVFDELDRRTNQGE